MNAEIFSDALFRLRRSGAIWGLSLVALVSAVVMFWPAMKDSGALGELTSELPGQMVSALGLEALDTPTGYLDGQLYALLLPVLLSAMAIASTNSLTAADEDAGRLELTFALPISRGKLYMSRFLAVLVAIAVLSLIVATTVFFGGMAVGLGVSAARVFVATTAVFFLAVLFSAFVFALAGTGVGSAGCIGASVALLTAAYLLFAVAPLASKAGALAKLSPWYWALGRSPFRNGLWWPGIALLVACSILLVFVGLLGVRRRSIRAA